MEPELTELLSLSLPITDLMDVSSFQRMVNDLLDDSSVSIPDVCASSAMTSASNSPVGYSAATPAIPYSSPSSPHCLYFQDLPPSHSQLSFPGCTSPASTPGSISFSGLFSVASTPESYRLVSPNYSPSSSPTSHISISSSSSNETSASNSQSLFSIPPRSPVSSSSRTSCRRHQHRPTPYPRFSPVSETSRIGATELEGTKSVRKCILNLPSIRYKDFQDLIRPRDDGELVPYHLTEPYLNLNFDLQDEESDWE